MILYYNLYFICLDRMHPYVIVHHAHYMMILYHFIQFSYFSSLARKNRTNKNGLFYSPRETYTLPNTHWHAHSGGGKEAILSLAYVVTAVK